MLLALRVEVGCSAANKKQICSNAARDYSRTPLQTLPAFRAAIIFDHGTTSVGLGTLLLLPQHLGFLAVVVRRF
jgi:hypothetical protein